MTDSGTDPDPDRAGIRGALAAVGAAMDDDELTPRQLKVLVAITFGSIAAFGIVSYLIVFVYLGF